MEGSGRLSHIKVGCAVTLDVLSGDESQGQVEASRSTDRSVKFLSSALLLKQVSSESVMIEVFHNQRLTFVVPQFTETPFAAFEVVFHSESQRQSFLDGFALLLSVSDSTCIVLFFKNQNGDRAIMHFSVFTVCSLDLL